MTRTRWCAASAAVALGVGAAFAAPAQAAEPALVSVCVTITPKSITIEVNGPLVNAPVEGTPTTCVGV